MLKPERLGVVLNPEIHHAKFNAGMIKENDVVHMLYRWAETHPAPENSSDGIHFGGYIQNFVSYAKLDLKGNVLLDKDKEGFIKLGEIDGRHMYTEDPRIVYFEGEYIIFFSAWNNEICRVGMARTKDFESYEMIGIIPTKEWDKDAFILPERVNGKIIYIHRIEPEIQIDYFDTFEDMLKKDYWDNYTSKKHKSLLIKGEYDWENMKVGGSIPPIRTELGWLFIYHGVSNDRVPFCYRAGAAILDINDPSKVLYRLPYPIIEPEEEYERIGDVDNVVFPQGMYIDGSYLYISYGGADRVTAMCRFKYNELIEELRNHPVK